MIKPISVGFLPTIQTDDIVLNFTLLLKPWLWKKGANIQQLEAWFRDYFGVKDAISFNSGRAAELAVLIALGIGPGDEVLLQAFTCVAVPNSILWTGAKPVYVDIKKNHFTMDIDDLIKKISPRTKAIIIQHTFGYPDDVEEILAIARQKKIYLIEDCAHALGGYYKGKKLGTFGDAAFFSFGRDKVISSVFGGMAIAKNSKVSQKLRESQQNLPYPSFWWILKQLFYPGIIYLGLQVYNFFSLGKALIEVSKILGFLSLPVSAEEKKTLKPVHYPQKLANAQAKLALHQIRKLDTFIARRKTIGERFVAKLVHYPLRIIASSNGLIRFPILTENPQKLLEFAKARNILLGRWYSHLIDPPGTNLIRTGYTRGDCVNAEDIAARVINLPTSPTIGDKDLDDLFSLLAIFYGTQN